MNFKVSLQFHCLTLLTGSADFLSIVFQKSPLYHELQSKSSVPVNFANSLSSIAPFFSFFSRRYSRANSSSSSIVCTERLCLAVFFLITVGAAFELLLGFWGFCSWSCTSFLACRFFFLCFSRDLSLNYHFCFFCQSHFGRWKIQFYDTHAKGN